MTGSEFLGMVASYGSFPLLVLLLVIIIIALKDHMKKHDEVDATLRTIQENIDNRFDAMSEQNDKTMGKLETRILYIEQNYAEKAYVQESVSGWRTEIRDLRRCIEDNNKRTDRIMEKMNGNCKND